MAEEQGVPKWGDPIESIPEHRRNELQRLYDAQVEWSRESHSERDSAPLQGAGLLNGAEVYFLSLYERSSDGRSWPSDQTYRSVREGFGYVSVHLETANMASAQLDAANLSDAHMDGAILDAANLRRANLNSAHLPLARLTGADLEDASAHGADLQGASLNVASLKRAKLDYANLRGANLIRAHLEGTSLNAAILTGADLRHAFFDASTELFDASIAEGGTSISAADVRWQGVNLAVVKEWPPDMLLDDERAARNRRRAFYPSTYKQFVFGQNSLHMPRELKPGIPIDQEQFLKTVDLHDQLMVIWEEAARANRQLAGAMRDQGMSAEADRFAYRGNVCQRQLHRLQGKHLRQFGSWLLDLVSGYGYRPWRSFVTYLVVVLVFALTYWVLGLATKSALTWNEVVVISLTAFHGRGFFPTAFQPGDPQAAVAALEAVIGLLIEITFIATFTQRFFAR